jgi:hypothetical protein
MDRAVALLASFLCSELLVRRLAIDQTISSALKNVFGAVVS